MKGNSIMNAFTLIPALCLPAALFAAETPLYAPGSDHLGQSVAPEITQTGEKAAESFEEEKAEFVFGAGIDFTSKQTTYGLIDNDDPIFTPYASIGYGIFSFDVAAIFDTTDWGEKHGGYGDRAWKYQEIAFGPTLTVPLGMFELFANYTYEYHPRVKKNRGYENPDTQFINLGVAMPDVLLSPSLSVEVDIVNEPGAAYFLLEIGHTFGLVEDCLDLNLSGGIGFGNAKRNRYDADFDSMGFKDISGSVALDWHITPSITLSPYMTASQQLQGRMRDAARGYIEDEKHNSAYVLFGVVLAAEF